MSATTTAAMMTAAAPHMGLAHARFVRTLWSSAPAVAAAELTCPPPSPPNRPSLPLRPPSAFHDLRRCCQVDNPCYSHGCCLRCCYSSGCHYCGCSCCYECRVVVNVSVVVDICVVVDVGVVVVDHATAATPVHVPEWKPHQPYRASRSATPSTTTDETASTHPPPMLMPTPNDRPAANHRG